uniref:Uncharacterized protein n=1 Tax=Glossina austeni TaxID=7395 RepID=A0A1A9V5U3_GLOAU
PLGELFDHGYDSISIVFIALSAATLIGYSSTGFNRLVYLILLIGKIMFRARCVLKKLTPSVPLYFAFGIDLLLVLCYAKVINNEKYCVNGPTVAVDIVGIAQKSPKNIFVLWLLVAAKVTNKLLIAHTTKTIVKYLDWSLLDSSLLFLSQYFDCIVPGPHLFGRLRT